jgi:hypothetical protein
MTLVMYSGYSPRITDSISPVAINFTSFMVIRSSCVHWIKGALIVQAGRISIVN